MQHQLNAKHISKTVTENDRRVLILIPTGKQTNDPSRLDCPLIRYNPSPDHCCDFGISNCSSSARAGFGAVGERNLGPERLAISLGRKNGAIGIEAHSYFLFSPGILSKAAQDLNFPFNAQSISNGDLIIFMLIRYRVFRTLTHPDPRHLTPSPNKRKKFK